jgi:hypothetical protein
MTRGLVTVLRCFVGQFRVVPWIGRGAGLHKHRVGMQAAVLPHARRQGDIHHRDAIHGGVELRRVVDQRPLAEVVVWLRARVDVQVQLLVRVEEGREASARGAGSGVAVLALLGVEEAVQLYERRAQVEEHEKEEELPPRAGHRGWSRCVAGGGRRVPGVASVGAGQAGASARGQRAAS